MRAIFISMTDSEVIFMPMTARREQILRVTHDDRKRNGTGREHPVLFKQTGPQARPRKLQNRAGCGSQAVIHKCGRLRQ